MSNRTTSFIITLIGIILLLIGIMAAFMGPVEVYCYYLFTEGGKFHYEGFGFGSFMFGNITLQVLGYYIIAIIFIPLGYGHLKKQSWVPKISLTLLWSWLILGIPLTMILLFIIVTTKIPSILILILIIIFLILSYTILPAFLIKFYRSKSVQFLLKQDDKKFNIIEKYPIPLLIITSLYLFYIFVFHLLLLYKGIFPFLGNWLIYLKGFIVITMSILFLVVLIIGTLNKKLWAWWASLIYFCFFTISSIITLLLSDLSEIITLLNFPETETDALINIPLEGIHLSAIFGIPLIITVGVILFSRKYFIVLKKAV